MRKGNAERGFTLVEIMIVVAIVALLAVIVVPQFAGETKKARGGAEVTAMFAELGVKLEQYKIENGAFPVAAADPGVTCPAAPANGGYNFVGTCKASPGVWIDLRVNPPESTMRCAYTLVTGTSADTLTVPSGFLNSAGAAGAEGVLASAWWYVTAECDQDGAGGTNSTYYTSSVDAKIQKQNEGK